jgi:hypothetical protein
MSRKEVNEMVTAVMAQVDEIDMATLTESDVTARGTETALQEVVMEITAGAMRLVKHDADELQHYADLDRLFEHMARENEAEDKCHKKQIALCRAAQGLVRRMAQKTAQPPVKTAAVA